MSRAAQPPAHDANAQVGALVQTLQQAEDRLKALAGGELDSVSDAGGRTFLLQHAQEQLVLNEAAKQAAILNALAAHIALLDPAGQIISVNEAWRQFAGSNALRDDQHGLGLNYLEACDGTSGDESVDAHQVAAGIRAVLAGTAPSFAFEYPCHSPTEQNWFLLKVMPLPGNPPQGAVVMHMNVTAERQAETDLRVSVALFRQMAENIDEVFFLVDVADRRMVYVSPAYEKITGYSCESLYANLNSLIYLIHPHDLLSAHEIFTRGFSAGKFEMAFRSLRADGSPCWIELRAFPVQDAAGQTIRVAGIAIDVSERKLAESKLHLKEQRYRSLVEATTAIVWETPASGEFETEQPGWTAFTGQRFEQLRGRGWLQAIHPDDREETGRVWSLALANRAIYAVEHRILAHDGTWHDMLVRAVPIIGADGEVLQWIGVHTDFTERKQAQTRMVYLNRVYAMLSGINLLIARVRERGELIDEACRIAVREGGFRMALIGIPDPATGRFVAVASAGMDPGMLQAIVDRHCTGAGAAAGRSLIDDVIRNREAVVSDDSRGAAATPFGVPFADAGGGSSAVLPLLLEDSVLGVLCLFAGEPNFFHQDEMRLLKELAGDIAFGIDRIAKQERLDYLAYYDALTGLANRSLFQDRLAQALRARDADQRLLATVFLDVERFRHVNDTLGRNAGDGLLRELGARLHRANDSAARIGGDVFGLILRGAPTMVGVHEELTSVFATCLDPPFLLPDGQELHLACTAGIALYPDDGTDVDALMRNAEAALRQGKLSSERIEFYAPAMNARVAEALDLEARLRRAVERNEFVLHYQPKVALTDGRIVGAEALIRWQDGANGLVSPGLFIPVLETTGLINDVGLWVVRQAFSDLCAWAARGMHVPRIAVNVSALQLRRRDFVDGMIEEIRRGGDHPRWLELEITEGIVMSNVGDSTVKLSILRSKGVTVAIDDFGTGYSSLSYLARLPVDALKIDQSFVAGLGDSAESVFIVSAIITLARSLKLKVVAEGVETEAQANMLRQLGCDQAQGHFFSTALAAATFAEKYLAVGD